MKSHWHILFFILLILWVIVLTGLGNFAQTLFLSAVTLDDYVRFAAVVCLVVLLVVVVVCTGIYLAIRSVDTD